MPALSTPTAPLVPRSKQELVGAHGDRAGQVDRIGTTQRVLAGQLTGVDRDRLGELHWPNGRPVLLPRHLGLLLSIEFQSVIASSRCQSSAHLAVGQPARDRGVTPVPQRRGDIGPILLDEQLHKGAAVEVDDRHDQTSAALVRDQLGHRPLRTRPGDTACGRSGRTLRPSQHPLAGQLLKKRRRIHCDQAGHRGPPIGDHDLLAGPDPLDPVR